MNPLACARYSHLIHPASLERSEPLPRLLFLAVGRGLEERSSLDARSRLPFSSDFSITTPPRHTLPPSLPVYTMSAPASKAASPQAGLPASRTDSPMDAKDSNESVKPEGQQPVNSSCPLSSPSSCHPLHAPSSAGGPLAVIYCASSLFVVPGVGVRSTYFQS